MGPSAGTATSTREDLVPGAFRCASGDVSVRARRAGREKHPGGEPTWGRAPTTRGVSALAQWGSIRLPRHPRGEAGQRSRFGGGWGRGESESCALRNGGPWAPVARGGRRAASGLQCPPPDGLAQGGSTPQVPSASPLCGRRAPPSSLL